MRIYYSHIGSPFVDVEWDSESVTKYKNRIANIFKQIIQIQKIKDKQNESLDRWLQSVLQRTIKKTTDAFEKFDLRVVANENTMVSFFEFGPNTPFMPNHKHPHEQTAYVLAGSLKMIAGGETKILKANEGAVIPPNVEHEVYPLEPGTKVMDVFYPIREDYL